MPELEIQGPEEASLYRRFWLHVILRAVEEAMGKNLIIDRKTTPLKVKFTALDWLQACGRDFQLICHLAQIDPEKVRRRFANGAPQRQDNKRNNFVRVRRDHI